VETGHPVVSDDLVDGKGVPGGVGIAQQMLFSNAARIDLAQLTLLRDNFSRAMRR
jgi:hypothetical protein